jgi:hypothetical protein
MNEKDRIADALRLIFDGIARLKDAFPKKEFTIDGRLVGDIGEVVAALEYDIDLFDVLVKGHDGKTPEGRLVQVKATFKDSLTFRTVPDYYIGLKLYRDGRCKFRSTSNTNSEKGRTPIPVISEHSFRCYSNTFHVFPEYVFG